MKKTLLLNHVLEDMTKNRDIFNKYTISLRLLSENMASSIIIYPGNRSLEFALVKTCNRFPYCTESRNILSYCTGLRKGVPDRTTQFDRWSP